MAPAVRDAASAAQNRRKSAERLRPEDRALLVDEITELYATEPKLHDMRPSVVRGYLSPPDSPDACIFSKTTACLSADLERAITPCQFGGNPDCAQCGCMASVGLQALGEYRIGGLIPVSAIFRASIAVGNGLGPRLGLGRSPA